jgi:hypothetical protein
MAADPLQFQLTEHDRRLSGLHKRLGKVEVKESDHDRSIILLESGVTEARKDVEKIEVEFDRAQEARRLEAEQDRKERRDGERATRKAIYALAGFMGTSALSICALIAVLVNHG